MKLSVIGLLKTTLTTETGKEIEQEIYVVKGLKEPLLGRPAIEDLGLVRKIGAIATDRIQNGDQNKPSCDLESNTKEKYPNSFHGLGEMDGEFEIKLKPDASPFALTTPRRVALPLMNKVKDELGRMERLGVILKVDEPTEWCAGIIVVPKSNEKIRICVDLTKLNDSVLRSTHPLPKIDNLLAQVSESKYFSKVDANSGFWQQKLAPESRLLTTFITPFGRYCFNRMPMGIKTAPEHYQKRMSQELDGLDGVIYIVDNILIHGRTHEEHDARLDQTLCKLNNAGITLNADKYEFSKTEIKFAGHILSRKGLYLTQRKLRLLRRWIHPHVKGRCTVSWGW